MQDKVVDIKSGRPTDEPIPEPSPWFAPIEHRIAQIERLLDRLEWQVWLVMCGVAAVILIEVLNILDKV